MDGTSQRRHLAPAGRGCTRLLIPVLAIQLLLTGCGNENEESKQGGPGGQRPPPTVGVLDVQPQTLDRTDVLPGRVVAYQVAEIRPQVSGIIQSRLFEEGSYVTEGQQLYQIDPARYRANYNMAQAALETAEAKRRNAQARASRSETLIKKNAISEQEYDDAVSALDQAEAAVSMAKAEVHMAEINLNYTEVRSPISGFIGPSSVTKGALVTERQTMPLATVRQLDPVYVDLSQSAAASGDVRQRLTSARLKNEGQATFTVTLYPDKTDEPYPHKGTLDAAELAVDPQTGSIRLRSVFPNPEKVLLPGIFVRASVVDAESTEKMVIPQKSVTIEPGGQEKSVWVLDSENNAQKRFIRTGEAYQNKWIVLEGLETGDRLIVEGTMSLSEGVKVNPEEAHSED